MNFDCTLSLLNKQGENIQPWHTPFPIWNQSVVPCPVLTVASWPAYRFLKRQVRWFGIPISLRIFQFVLIHMVKSFSIVNKAEVHVFFWNSLAFLMIQCMLAIWSLVPLPFLNPVWTFGSSRFTYCWNLAWRILSITLLACEMSAIGPLANHKYPACFWHQGHVGDQHVICWCPTYWTPINICWMNEQVNLGFWRPIWW